VLPFFDSNIVGIGFISQHGNRLNWHGMTYELLGCK
jgi:hypothetical protein